MNYALITGASSGIGREFVSQAVASGKYDGIIVIARRANRLDELSAKYGSIIIPLALDIEREESFPVITEKLSGLRESGGITLLVCCAGLGKYGAFDSMSRENCEKMINLNILGLTRTVRSCLDFITPGGRIILLGSQSAFQPLPYFNIYAATKAFVLHFGRALNLELKDRQISVTTVCPGYVDTEFFSVAEKSESPDACTNFKPLYKPCAVVRKALADSVKKRDMSVFGVNTNMMRLCSKLLPHSLVMHVWIKIK